MPVEPNPSIYTNGHSNGRSSGPTHSHSNGYTNGHGPSVLTLPYPAVRSSHDELDLGQLLQIARRRGRLIAVVALAVTSSIWGWTLTRTAIYRGEFRVLVEPVADVDRSQELLQTLPNPGTSTFDYETQIEVLRSPALLEPIAKTLQKQYPDISYGSLASGLIIGRLRDTKVLAVSYLDPNPEKIKVVLEEVSKQYLSYSFQQRQTSLQQGIIFVDDQLPELRDRVNTLQARLERFRQQYSIIDPQSRGNDLSSQLSGIEKQRQETQTQLSEARSLYSTLQGQLGYTPGEALAAATLSESPSYQAILRQVQEVENQIAAELARFEPGTINIQVLEDKRDSLLPRLDEEAERLLGDRLSRDVDDSLTGTSLELNRQLLATANQVRVLESRSAALASVEERLKQEFAIVPALAREYTELQRELTIATESLNRFLGTRETLQIDAAQKSIPWELLSEPSVPLSPISPNVPRNLMLGAIAGLLLGSAVALLAEKLDTTFHSPEEIKTITKLPLLAVVPFVKSLKQSSSTPSLTEMWAQRLGLSQPSTATDSTQFNSGLNNGQASGGQSRQAATTPRTVTTGYYQSSPFLEAFRSFYANIRFLSSDAPIRSIVISSAAPSEGKSTTALHLAKSAAAMGQRVLLVDADLRCPQVHGRLNLPNVRGLSNFLSSDMPLNQAIQVGGTSPATEGLDHNLFVLTAGPVPPDPVKLLSSRKMHALMMKLHSQFDLVIYDMPPLIGFADSTVLAAHTDGMVLVVGLGKTDRGALQQALEALKISSVTVLGVVANGIREYTTHAYGYYKNHRYYQQQSQQNQQNGRHGAVPYTNGSGHGSAEEAGQHGSVGQNGSMGQNGAAGQNGYATPEAAHGRTGQPQRNGYGSPSALQLLPDADRSTWTVEDIRSTPRLVNPLVLLPPRLRIPVLVTFGVSMTAALMLFSWVVYKRMTTLPQESRPQPPQSSLTAPAIASEATAIPTAASQTLPLEESLTQRDPFDRAVHIAEAAAVSGESAATTDEWLALERQWKQAALLMEQVKPDDRRYAIAKDRALLYRLNADQASQKVEETRFTQ